MSDQSHKPRAGTFLIAQINGEAGNKSASVALVSDDNVPFFLANNSLNKAAVSLDQLFLPIASRSGEVNLQESGSIPFLGGTALGDGRTQWGSNSATNKILAVDRTVINMVTAAGGLALGVAPSIGSGQVLSTEEMNNLVTYSGEIRRVIGMRLPMFAVGMGLTVSGGVQGEIAGNSHRIDSPGGARNEDFTAMKAGPVDLRWDERKHAWVGSDFFSSDIVYGFLSSDITAPADRYSHTIFTIDTQLYKNDGTWGAGPTVGCLNKDPNFSISGYGLVLVGLNYVPNMDIFVKAIRLQSPTFSDGYVYMPFYIGCE